jgi:hypothetical protein
LLAAPEAIDPETVAQAGALLAEVFENLSPRERRILQMRFGVGEGTEHTLEEVAKALWCHARAHPPDRGEGSREVASTRPRAQAA